MMLLRWLLACLYLHTVTGFVVLPPAVARPEVAGQWTPAIVVRPRHDAAGDPLALLATIFEGTDASSSGEGVDPDKNDKDVAQELLSRLINHAQTRGIRAKDNRIEELIQVLVERRVEFDPAACLNGPLYAVAYQSGPSQPFWVRYSILSPSFNIEGQQYTLRKEDGGFDVVNYGEFFGSALTVQARGIAYAEQQGQRTVSPLLQVWESFVSRQTKDPATATSLVRCPVNFSVEVDKACCTFWKKASFALDISGKAEFAVLYADHNLRILTTKTSGPIEQEGFSAVQIRVDYLDPHFPSLLTFPLD